MFIPLCRCLSVFIPPLVSLRLRLPVFVCLASSCRALLLPASLSVCALRLCQILPPCLLASLSFGVRRDVPLCLL